MKTELLHVELSFSCKGTFHDVVTKPLSREGLEGPKRNFLWKGLKLFIPRGEKEKPHRTGHPRLTGPIRCGSPKLGLGSGVGLPGIQRNRFNPGQVRVLLFPYQKGQTTTATMIPGETI